MTQTLTEKLTATSEGMRLYQQERAIQEATDLICEVMEEEGVNRAELAHRLGKTKGYITQLLDGRTNMTLRTLSDVLGILGRAVHLQDGPLSATVLSAPLISIREGLDWCEESVSWPSDMPVSAIPTPIKTRLVG